MKYANQKKRMKEKAIIEKYVGDKEIAIEKCINDKKMKKKEG